jgi:hypothetical protein
MILGADILQFNNASINLDKGILEIRDDPVTIPFNTVPISTNDVDTVQVAPQSKDLPEDAINGWTAPNIPNKVFFDLLNVEFADLFAQNTKAPPTTPKVEHAIYVKGPPIKCRRRKKPPAEIEVEIAEIKKMLANGIIRPSTSEWASLVVLVRKSDGTWRFCINFGPLNDITFLDSYPLPRIDDILHRLQGACVFSTIDLASGYWQIRMKEEDKPKTAFISEAGLFEFNVMPFGLANGPPSFQRLIEEVLQDTLHQCSEGYIDDIIVFSPSIEQHLIDLRKVLERLREYGLSMKMVKCRFLASLAHYLGHLVSADGISANPEKIRAVSEYPVPKDVSAVKAFLGLAGYYRKHVNQFAAKAAPLNNLTRSNVPFVWSGECEVSFQSLKQALISAPILVHVIPGQPFTIDCDACTEGIGAVLSQSHGVIEYASRSLTDAEKRYFTTELETLAVVWALQKFYCYIYGVQFTVHTDHAAVSALINRKRPDKMTGANGRIERWILGMSHFKPYMTLKHRPGKENGNSDGLSRGPLPDTEPAYDDNAIDLNVSIIAACNAVIIESIQETNTIAPVVEADEEPADNMEPIPVEPEQPLIHDIIAPMQPQDIWAQLQEHTPTDEVLGPILRYLTSRELPPDDKLARIIVLEAPTYQIDDGVLLKRPHRIKEPIWRMALPACMRTDVIMSFHATPIGGHLATQKTIHRVLDRFYWANAADDIAAVIAACPVCQRRKRRYRAQPGMLHPLPPVARPLERVALDIIPMHSCKTPRGYCAILTIVDYCTRFVELYALQSETADEVAHCLLAFICRFGAPRHLLSDRGRVFLGNIVTAVNTMFRIHKLNTSPYHPQTDGLVERINGIMESILRSYVARCPLNWDLYLPLAKFAYNTSYQSTIKTSPHEALFGFKATYPFDTAIRNLVAPTRADYLTGTLRLDILKRTLQDIWVSIQDNLTEAQAAQAEAYNAAREDIEYSIGDLVLLDVSKINLGREGYQKLRADWHGPYRIIEKPSPLLYKLEAARDGVNSGIAEHAIHIARLKPFHLLPEGLRQGRDPLLMFDEDFAVYEPQEMMPDWILGQPEEVLPQQEDFPVPDAIQAPENSPADDPDLVMREDPSTREYQPETRASVRGHPSLSDVLDN